jgi:hypothetical protein
MQIVLKPLAKGLLTFIPGAQRVLPRFGTGGTNSAEYCYGVWLKHLAMQRSAGARGIPNALAELGPGDSIGVGLAAMLSGVNHYYALDVVRYSDNESNLKVFDELVAMFQARAPRPHRGWPDFDQYLDAGLFPSDVLTPARLAETLDPDRIQAIRNLLRDNGKSTAQLSIQYIVPWSDQAVIANGSLDTIISHSVLEHVMDLRGTYSSLNAWLRDGGIMSHQVDFGCHGIAQVWNGYWTYSDRLWKLICGKREYLINRAPCSQHLEWLRKTGFKVCLAEKQIVESGIPRSALAPRWADLSTEDLHCASLFVVAQKMAG